ncbi:hypothetical protein ACP70R_040782 [Stipagrostis hirtigluma subsp. patula]
MAGRWLLDLWKEWGIQIMVLASFSLQVFLLTLGGTRRRSSYAVLRIALWLVYLSADSTAIYTLGHLSVASSSREHRLVAFWAPFLLLHLGGPDNITAYALEDNRLWLRHLQTLVVQALGAAYVIYKYIFSDRNGSLLLLATISMFVAGIAKYGERIWALKCGNISNIADSFDSSENRVKNFRSLTQWPSDEEEILLSAHSHFDICKGAFTDVKSSVESDSNSPVDSESTGPGDECAKQDHLKLYKLVEMELSLMYDLLYTKASVIHTWYGFCIHLISLLATATAFLLFQLSISHSWDGHSSVDVVISYVLLVGALVLEAMSLCRALLSTWTCSFLHRSEWKGLLGVITSLRQCLQPASRRLWGGSIAQYNLLQVSTSSKKGMVRWLTKKLGLEDWWNTQYFLGSQCCSMEDLKLLVLGEIATIDTGMNSRGSEALQRHNISEHLKWSVDIDLDNSILTWHIVTDLVIWLSNDGEVNTRLVEATKVLSNYMMFLLVAKPDMLPGRTRRNLYRDACKELDSYYKACLQNWSQWVPVESRPQPDMLADWLLADLYNKVKRTASLSPEREHAIRNAIRIYDCLLDSPVDKDKYMEIIFQVWVEIMVYVAEHCSRDSHARQLSQGGEFITIIWIMVAHRKYYKITEDAKPKMASDTSVPLASL